MAIFSIKQEPVMTPKTNQEYSLLATRRILRPILIKLLVIYLRLMIVQSTIPRIWLSQLHRRSWMLIWDR